MSAERSPVVHDPLGQAIQALDDLARLASRGNYGLGRTTMMAQAATHLRIVAGEVEARAAKLRALAAILDGGDL